MVPDPAAEGTMVLNVDREPVEEHLANVRSFILTWYLKQSRPNDDKIIRQVARLDMNIRRKWWRSYRDDSEGTKTFTSCILEHRAYADQQWDGDYEIQMYPPWEKKDSPKKDNKGKGKGAKGEQAQKKITVIGVWLNQKKVKAAE